MKIVDVSCMVKINKPYIFNYISIPEDVTCPRLYLKRAAQDLRDDDRFGMTHIFFTNLVQLDELPVYKTEYLHEDGKWTDEPPNDLDLDIDEFECEDIRHVREYYNEWSKGLVDIENNMVYTYHQVKEQHKQIVEQMAKLHDCVVGEELFIEEK